MAPSSVEYPEGSLYSGREMATIAGGYVEGYFKGGTYDVEEVD